MVARVQPLTTTRRLAGLFDYAVDPDRPPRRGSLVRITFGHQHLRGIVTELAETSELPAERLSPIDEVLDTSLPEDLLELAYWMADEYCSTPARALSLMLPPNGRPRTVLWAGPGREPAVEDALTARQRSALDRLPAPLASDREMLRKLEARGLVMIEPRTQRRAPTVAARADRPVTLSEEQRAALEAIDADGTFLLHGVTGSGKTEVYLRAAARALQRGQGAIILVPEISLTPQTVARFTARFGDTVALLHSSLSEGERYDEWQRLRSGAARVAVGPRSAVFAPVADLGLIVIDEEHESAYKHEGDPGYDARRVAGWRAAWARRRSSADAGNVTLLAGTATPRPETWRSIPRISMPSRVDGQHLPPVATVDMRGVRGALHPDTARALAASPKSIVLLNRRGWSNFLTCRDCGKVWECPRCDVALVLHRAADTLACHHCGHRERVPTACDACGSLAVARHGAGTERLESELAELLDVPVFRLDADTAARKDAVPELLDRFAAASRGVLLGTQMVAKGHDFPDVTLAVVIDADSTLRFPDFRAEERTFALVTQLAGRAGRGERGGHVLVQTLSPEVPAIVAATRHDAAGFLAGELQRRAALGYPPFSSLVRIGTSAVDAAATHRAAHRIAAEVQKGADALMRSGAGRPGASTVLGPAPLFRVRDRHRHQILVKTDRRREVVTLIRGAVERTARDADSRAVSFSVDVDPQ